MSTRRSRYTSMYRRKRRIAGQEAGPSRRKNFIWGRVFDWVCRQEWFSVCLSVCLVSPAVASAALHECVIQASMSRS